MAGGVPSCAACILVLLALLTHAWKECTHQLALPWGTRHLISPELAGKDVMILSLFHVKLGVAEGSLEY